MISRHGERFLVKEMGNTFNSVMEVFKRYGEFHGDLSFLNDYEYFVTNPDYYEKETTPKTQKVHILELQIYYDMELILEKDINHYLTKGEACCVY